MDISEWKVKNQKLSLFVSIAITLPNDLIFIVSSYALSLADYLSAELRKRRTMIANGEKKSSKWRNKYKDESQSISLQCQNHQNLSILYDLADFSIIQTKCLYQVLRSRNTELLPEIRVKRPYTNDHSKTCQVSLRDELVLSRKQSVNASMELQKLEDELWITGLAACKHYLEASKQFLSNHPKHSKNKKTFNEISISCIRESIKSIRYMDQCHDLLDELQQKKILSAKKRKEIKKEIITRKGKKKMYVL